MAKHIRLIYQNTGETTQFGDLQKANIVRNGERGIDVASFEVSNRNEVKQNANIKFLSDVADVTFLTAIYNFQGSFRDESGINSLDGSGSAGFETPNTGNNTYKFSPNYAVEFDSDCESNFNENLQLNHIEKHIHYYSDDVLTWEDFNYNIILANINCNIIEALIPKFKGTKAQIILSGLLKTDHKSIEQICIKQNFQVKELIYLDLEWLKVYLVLGQTKSKQLISAFLLSLLFQ